MNISPTLSGDEQDFNESAARSQKTRRTSGCGRKSFLFSCPLRFWPRFCGVIKKLLKSKILIWFWRSEEERKLPKVETMLQGSSRENTFNSVFELLFTFCGRSVGCLINLLSPPRRSSLEIVAIYHADYQLDWRFIAKTYSGRLTMLNDPAWRTPKSLSRLFPAQQIGNNPHTKKSFYYVCLILFICRSISLSRGDNVNDTYVDAVKCDS